MRARQKDYRVGHARVAARERVHGEKHRANFKDLCGDRDASFAEAVGQKAACHREQQEWKCEEIPNDKNQQIFFRSCRIGPQDQEDDKELEPVVVERALELRGDQAPETEPPLFFRLSKEDVFFGRHARSPKRCD